MSHRSAHDEWNELARLAAQVRDAVVNAHRQLGSAEQSVKFTRAAFDAGQLFEYRRIEEVTLAVTTLLAAVKTFRYACSVSHYLGWGDAALVRVFAPGLRGILEHVLCVREVDVRDAHGKYTPEFGLFLITLSYVLGCNRELTLEVEPE